MMPDKVVDNSRRRFVKLTAAGIAAAPLSTLLLQGTAQAADMPKVEESDPMAKNLSYVHDATKADPAKRAGDEKFCDNCKLYKAGSEDGWGECAVFPGKLVNAKGWCSAWVTNA